MDNFSNLMMIGECLLDADRVNFFHEGIVKLVKKGDVVIDAGTGSGILALCAARAGASKVYAVEIDPYIAEVARHNVAINGFSDVIEVVACSINDFRLSDKGLHQTADVLVMEMLDTGLISEQQAVGVRSLKMNGSINEDTKLLVQSATSKLRLVNYDFSFLGFKTDFIIQARNFEVLARVKNVISSPEPYLFTDLYKLDNLEVDSVVELVALSPGICNAVELSTSVVLAGKEIEATSDMNMPLIIPLPEAISLQKGESQKIRISYSMGSGFSSFSVKLIDG